MDALEIWKLSDIGGGTIIKSQLVDKQYVYADDDKKLMIRNARKDYKMGTSNTTPCGTFKLFY